MVDSVLLEIVIAQEVSSRIAENIGALTPQETAEIYFSALGACIAELYPDSTSATVQQLAGEWAKFGFCEANRMNFDMNLTPYRPVD